MDPLALFPDELAVQVASHFSFGTLLHARELSLRYKIICDTVLKTFCEKCFQNFKTTKPLIARLLKPSLLKPNKLETFFRHIRFEPFYTLLTVHFCATPKLFQPTPPHNWIYQENPEKLLEEFQDFLNERAKFFQVVDEFILDSSLDCRQLKAIKEQFKAKIRSQATLWSSRLQLPNTQWTLMEIPELHSVLRHDPYWQGVAHLHGIIKCDNSAQEALRHLDAECQKKNQNPKLDAIYLLGLRCFLENAPEKKGLNLLIKAAEMRHPIAQYFLAKVYLTGKGVEYPQVSEGMRLLRLSAKQGYPKAQSDLGIILINESADRNTQLEGVEFLRQAAEQQDGSACLELGNLYAEGRIVQQNRSLAETYYRQVLPHNPGKAYYALGKLKGMQEEAFELMLKAANCQYAPAYRALWDLYKQHKRTEPAHHWMRQAAESGDIDAQFQLGSSEKRFEESVGWLRRAANQHHAQAQAALGQALFKAKQYPEALLWLKASADRDHATSLNLLGYFYADGLGGAVDINCAIKYFKAAAEQQDRKAEFNLGLMHLRQKNESEALKWFRLAQEHGIKEAAHHVKKLEARN